MLLREDTAWSWGREQEEAWRTLKEAVKTAPMLKLPDPEEPFWLYTDWSSSGMGAVLCQKEKGTERVVAYASGSCSPAESNYSSYEGEGLAAVWAVELFRPYLQGRRFTLVTDHQLLLWLMRNQTLKGRNARWAMCLQEFDFEVKHRPGKTLQHVDGLSRQDKREVEKGQVTAEISLAHLAVAMEKEGWLRRSPELKGSREIWEDAPVLDWEPILPVDAPRIMVEPMATDDPRQWAAVAAARASYLRSVLPAALENLEVAQLRDARRYNQRQQGTKEGRGRPQTLQVGDEVYLREQRRDMLECGLSRERWEVVKVKDSEVLDLRDSKGRRVRDHDSNVARSRGSRQDVHYINKPMAIKLIATSID
ncbi:hypothetical protein CLOM_g18839 [Closterium sp. NIES-68]|nr:hypothetical protein CLOM_g18839 [Closterium sp. NIES-68]